MIETRRRQLAWLFALVLLTELALFCCASVHIENHVCPGHDCCALCAALRAESRLALLAAIAAVGLMRAAMAASPLPRRAVSSFDTPISRRVRLND